MEENPKLGLASPCDHAVYGLVEGKEMDSQKTSVSDLPNATRPDNFVIDMNDLSSASNINSIREIPSNSRITLQRTFSRKGSLQGGVKKMIMSASNTATNNGDSSSPRGSASTLEKAGVGPFDHQLSTVLAGNIGSTERSNSSSNNNNNIVITSKNSALKRSPLPSSSSSWLFDPKRILLFFATLSSIGTILLIYFTLSMRKLGSGEDKFD